MSDDGVQQIRISVGGGGGGGGDPKKAVGMMAAFLNLLIKGVFYGIEKIGIFFLELCFFFDEKHKRRYHWLHYSTWALYFYAIAGSTGALASALFFPSEKGVWYGLAQVGGILVFSFAAAGLVGYVFGEFERFLIKRGGWLAWQPGVGYKDKDRILCDMPWQKVLGVLPWRLGPKFAGQKLFDVKVTRRQTAAGGGEGLGVKEAKPVAVDYLPMPAYQAFGLGAANVDETVLRGTKIVDGFAYRKTLEGAARRRGEGGLSAGLMTFGAVPWLYDGEPQHLMVSGKSGSGKTQQINTILRTARSWRGNPALIADPAGGYLARFGRDTDSVLNPFDIRSKNWSPFAEMVNPYDAAIIAKATIPDSEGSSGEWNHYAQSLLTEVLLALHKRGEKNASKVLYFCATAPREELEELLKGTPAAVLTQKSNDRMLGNVRGIISTYMGSWQYLRDGGDFSVREFVRNSDSNGGAFLFMTYTDAQMGMLKFLIATWMELAIIEGLSLSESATRRLWIVLDELDSLGKISSLKAGLTKLRKYGVCCICGIQTVAQLRGNYGREDAQTLLSCMATKLVLSPGDNETADYMSKEMGEQEIERLQVSEGTSQKTGFIVTDLDKGASTNKHLHRQTQAAVMPSQMLALPNLHGFLRMPGSDVYQVVIPYVSMPDINEPFEAATF